MTGASSAGEFVAFDDAAIAQSIPARFEAQVARHPGRPAVVAPGEELSYAELDGRATRVARAILAELGAGEEPVALLFGHGAGVIAAILGVLKAGKVYVALDPGYPAARSTYVLEDAGARLLVTDAAHRARAEELAGGRLRVIDCDGAAMGTAGDAPPLPRMAPGTGSLILYTSGSTGRPKGVLHSHRSVLVEARNYTNDAHIVPGDRMALWHSHSFANSVRNLYGALLNGAAVLPFDLAAEGVAPVAAWLNEYRVTMVHTLATIFRRLMDALPPDAAFPTLRLLRLGGEPITPADVREFQRRFAPPCVLMHAMGPTETLTIRRHFIDHAWQSADGRVPVGHAVPGKEILLLDESGAEVASGEVGEIAVRSAYLALGYWRRPELTEAAFRPDPRGEGQRLYLTGDLGVMRAGDSLVHMGRKDFQVKIRGQRVEVGEVESALLDLPSVRTAAVHAQARAGEQYLVGYVVPAARPAPTVSELRRALLATLPAYMVPAHFVFLDALPVSPTGKTDRRALPAPDRERPPLDAAFVAPRTPIESALARIWAEVLDRERVGVHDDFLDLGGHSLLAGQVLARVEQVLPVGLTMQVLATAPTVAELAAAILELCLASGDPGAIQRLLARAEAWSDEAEPVGGEPVSTSDPAAEERS